MTHWFPEGLLARVCVEGERKRWLLALIAVGLVGWACEDRDAYSDPVGPVMGCVGATQSGADDARSRCLEALGQPGCDGGFEGCRRSVCASETGEGLAACAEDGPSGLKGRFLFFAEVLAQEYDVSLDAEVVRRVQEEAEFAEQGDLGRVLVEIREGEDLARESRAVLSGAAMLSAVIFDDEAER